MRVIGQAIAPCWMGIRQTNILHPAFQKNLKDCFMPLSCNHHSDKSRSRADWAAMNLPSTRLLNEEKLSVLRRLCRNMVSPAQWKRQHHQFQFLLVRIRSRSIKHLGHGFTEIKCPSSSTFCFFSADLPVASYEFSHSRVIIGKESNSTRKSPNKFQPAQLLCPSLDLCSSTLVHNSKNK